MKGGGQKVGMSLETQGEQTVWRDILGFLPGHPATKPKKFEEKSVFDFWP